MPGSGAIRGGRGCSRLLEDVAKVLEIARPVRRMVVARRRVEPGFVPAVVAERDARPAGPRRDGPGDEGGLARLAAVPRPAVRERVPGLQDDDLAAHDRPLPEVEP